MILTYNGSDSITDLERTVPAENTYMTHIKKYNTKQEKRSQKKENNWETIAFDGAEGYRYKVNGIVERTNEP